MQSHVYEITGRDDYVTIHRVREAESAEHYNGWHLADENANDMLEVYEIVDGDIKRFISRPKEINTFTVLAKKEIQCTKYWTSAHEYQGPNVCPSCQKLSLHGRREPPGRSREYT